MPDYAEMYKALFQAQTKAIAILQVAQGVTEDLYISTTEPDASAEEAPLRQETAHTKRP